MKTMGKKWVDHLQARKMLALLLMKEWAGLMESNEKAGQDPAENVLDPAENVLGPARCV